jgi:hypothetical protein
MCEIGSTIVDIAFMFYFVFFLVSLFSVLSFLPWDSLWLVEEGLTFALLFNCENGDFLFLMGDISIQVHHDSIYL